MMNPFNLTASERRSFSSLPCFARLSLHLMRVRLLALVLAGALAGCDGVVYDERLDGSYRLVAIDDDS